MKPVNETTDSHDIPAQPSTYHALHWAHLGHRWAALIGMLALGLLYLFLPDKLIIGPSWLLLVLEAVLIIPVIASVLTQRLLPHRMIRLLGLSLLGITTLALATGIILLVSTLPEAHGTTLLSGAGILWVFNVLVFSLWYFEIDGGGPFKRRLAG